MANQAQRHWLDVRSLKSIKRKFAISPPAMAGCNAARSNLELSARDSARSTNDGSESAATPYLPLVPREPLGRLQHRLRFSITRTALRQIPGRFHRNQSGATAVEFALVALPFLTMLGVIIEIGFSLWAAQNLDFVLQKTARSLFTGEFQLTTKGSQKSSELLDLLKSKMCGSSGNSAVTLFDCANVKLDVLPSSSFASGSLPSSFNAQSKGWSTSAGTQYSCPMPGQIVIVSAAVKFPVFFPFLKLNATVFEDGSRLLQSTAVFRTEPYQVTSTTGCGT